MLSHPCRKNGNAASFEAPGCHWFVTAVLVALLTLLGATPVAAKETARSFSLSTTRTFAPGESVKVQLLARNTPSLEFRVYKVRDAEKFFAGLKDLHSFGAESQPSGEQIDERTWLERLHDFKAHLWWTVRRFFRGQFTDDARDTFREKQASMGSAAAWWERRSLHRFRC